MMSPFSNRLTVAFFTSPICWLYSVKMFSRSASRTFWKMTCLAVWAAMRPSTSVGFGNSISSPSSMPSATSSPYSSRYIWRASSIEISVAALVTSCTTCLSAKRSTWPVSRLKRVLRFSPVL